MLQQPHRLFQKQAHKKLWIGVESGSHDVVAHDVVASATQQQARKKVKVGVTGVCSATDSM